MALDQTGEAKLSRRDYEAQKMPVLLSYADLVEGMKKIEGDEDPCTVRYLSKDIFT